MCVRIPPLDKMTLIYLLPNKSLKCLLCKKKFCKDGKWFRQMRCEKLLYHLF